MQQGVPYKDYYQPVSYHANGSRSHLHGTYIDIKFCFHGTTRDSMIEGGLSGAPIIKKEISPRRKTLLLLNKYKRAFENNCDLSSIIKPVQ